MASTEQELNALRIRVQELETANENYSVLVERMSDELDALGDMVDELRAQLAPSNEDLPYKADPAFRPGPEVA